MLIPVAQNFHLTELLIQPLGPKAASKIDDRGCGRPVISSEAMYEAQTQKRRFPFSGKPRRQMRRCVSLKFYAMQFPSRRGPKLTCENPWFTFFSLFEAGAA